MPAKPSYPTGPVDPTLPMELDDGRAVRFISGGPKAPWIHVRVVGDPSRRQEYGYEEHMWSYSPTTGVFGGGSAENYCVLRNVDLSSTFEPEIWD